MSDTFEIPFPFRGLSEGLAFGKQPPLTTRRAVNVRPYGAESGRARGGSRSGLSRFCEALVAPDQPVQTMEHAALRKRGTKFIPLVQPQQVWTLDMEAVGNDSYMANTAGKFFTSVATDTIAIVSHSGAVIGTRYLSPFSPSGVSRPRPQPIRFYIRPPFLFSLRILTGRGSDPDYFRLNKFEIQGATLQPSWEIIDTIGSDLADLGAIQVNQNAIHIALPEPSLNRTILRKYRDTTAPAGPEGPEWEEEIDIHIRDMASNPNFDIFVTGESFVDPVKMLRKLNSVGEHVWTYKGAGCGGAVRRGRLDDKIFAGALAPSTVHAVRLTDNGATVTEDWTYTDSDHDGLTTDGRGFAVDPWNNLYMVLVGGASPECELVRVRDDGSGSQWRYSTDLPANGADVVWGETPAGMDPGEEAPENLWLVHTRTGTDDTNAQMIRQLEGVTTDLSLRSTMVVGASAGCIRAVNEDREILIPTGAGSFPTAPILDPDARWFHSVYAYSEVFFTDGIHYKVWTPDGSHIDPPGPGAVSDWLATSGGIMPSGCRLLERWRGRAILSGAAGDPHNWYMSAFADFRNFEYFPFPTRATQAVAGNNSAAGRLPDIVTGFIPYNDDLAIFLGDQSIWRLTGDPMEGGRFDLVSDITGAAFGRAWAKDDHGIVYFFGSKGGVYRMTPGSLPESMTAGRIEKRLQEIDLNANKVQLAWNQRDRTLHVFVTPFAADPTEHYCWDQRTDSWWVDEFKDPSLDGFAVHTVDGDRPDDRRLLLGGRDGRIRIWDPDADTDDGFAIASRVFMGPISPYRPVNRTSLQGVRSVLAEDSGPVTLEAWFGDTFERALAGPPAWTQEINANRNDQIRLRGVGLAAMLALRGTGSWELESLVATTAPGGVVRGGA